MEARYNKRGAEAHEEPKNKAMVTPKIRAAFSPSTINEESRTIEVVFGSDTPTRMWSWDHGYIMETLSFERSHVDMSRLNGGAPLLDNHNNWGSVGDVVVGVVESARTDGKQGYAKVRFAKDEKSDAIFQKVKDGIIRNISVGYVVNQYEVTRATKKGELDNYRATSWEPHEISLVPVPADATAQVRSFDSGPPIEIIESQEEAERQKQEIENQRSAQIRVLLAQYPNT